MSSSVVGRDGLRYLFWCASEHLDFRIPEFEALASLFRIPLRWVESSKTHPWLIIDLPSEQAARALVSRSVSAKYCIQVWGDGESREALHRSVRGFPSEMVEPHCRPEKSFKIYVEAFMRKLTLEERVRQIETFSYLPIQGPVQLDEPDVVFSSFEFFGLNHNALPPEPTRAFFGRCVGEGQRRLVNKLSIKTRKFIGNTTMDPQLALLMSNLAGVRPGDVVLDPFVGTGSLLIAAAQFGAFVVGGDIDYLMLHARTRPSRVGQKTRQVDESMRANFEQYGLLDRYLDVVVSDFSRPPWQKKGLFRAIITDPPYGIREPTTKIGTNKDNVVIAEENIGHHVPQKIDYCLGELYRDLVNFAAENLEEDGRLVFWLPVVREDYSEDKLPRHPRLQLVANCEQVLSSHTSRRLLVMRKTPHSTEDAGEAAPVLAITAAEFREQFYKHQDIPKKERKQRVKKYGHLNVNGDKPMTEAGHKQD